MNSWNKFLLKSIAPLFLAFVMMTPLSWADTLNIAVASNFATTAELVGDAFEKSSGHTVRFIRGSSGKHYAQIRNGAPFDVFLSADQQRPRRLLEEGHGVEGSLVTYAQGQLALWTPTTDLLLDENYLLNTVSLSHLSMANPRLAPYGMAATELLRRLKVHECLQPKLVMGENVGQAFQFVYSGNADAGLVAYSQILALESRSMGSHWLIPNHYYSPIKQDMILLSNSSASHEFLSFMFSKTVAQILLDSGYNLPGEAP